MTRGTGSAPSRQAALKAVVLLKTGTRNLRGFWCANLDAAVAFVQLFDAAAAADVTLGTTVPDAEFAIAASGGGFVNCKDLQFTKGICAASSTAAGGGTSGTNGVHATFLIGS